MDNHAIKRDIDAVARRILASDADSTALNALSKDLQTHLDRLAKWTSDQPRPGTPAIPQTLAAIDTAAEDTD